MNKEQIENGVFCSLKMGRWDARAPLPTNKLGKNIPTEIIRAKQDTIEDRTLLGDLLTIRRMAKGILKRNSLPFPIDGIFWVPKDKIHYLDEQFSEFKAEYETRITKLCDNIKKMEEAFKSKYPKYYDPNNYPSQKVLRKKFYFYWTFLHFAAPSKKTKVLSPALYKREQEKFTKMIGQMEEMTINLIGNSLLNRIDKLLNQCESGKINKGTIGGIDKFLKQWTTLWKDHIDEAKLKNIMSSLKSQMKNVSAERLKNNEDFRNHVKEKLNTISKKIKKIPDFSLKRKLDI
jgi:hypothetical protein